MPRNGRGGARQGKIGTTYSNRSDLNAPKAAAPTAVPGQQYGAATAQLNAQRLVPMASGDITSTPGAASPPTAPGAGPAATPAPPLGLPPGVPPPGSMGTHTDPTDRPDEHLMTGVPAGPGQGPEALTPMVNNPLLNGVALLNALGDQVGPDIAVIRAQAQASLANRQTP